MSTVKYIFNISKPIVSLVSTWLGKSAVVLPTEHTLNFYLDFKNKHKNGF